MTRNWRHFAKHACSTYTYNTPTWISLAAGQSFWPFSSSCRRLQSLQQVSGQNYTLIDSLITAFLFARWSLGQVAGDLRLSTGRGASNGRLQVYIGREWGEICDTGFGMNEADVACHQLGFVGAVSVGDGNNTWVLLVSVNLLMPLCWLQGPCAHWMIIMLDCMQLLTCMLLKNSAIKL